MSKKVASVRLQNNRLKEVLRSVGKVVYQAIVEDAVTKEDLLSPDFYSLVGGRFVQAGVLPEIEIVPDDRSWYFKGIVFDSGSTFAVVKEIIYVEFDKKKPAKVKDGKKVDSDKVPEQLADGGSDVTDADQGYRVMRQGDVWSVIAPNGDIVSTDHKTKSVAQRELEEHLIVLRM